MIDNFNTLKEVLPEQELETRTINIGLGPEYELNVLQYLPIQGKANLLQYVINSAIDDSTGCFSPIRVNVYYCIGVMRSYCGLHFDDDVDVLEAYDILESRGIIDNVMAAIPEEERGYMETLINDTIEDITRYNTSLAGIVQSMSGQTTELDTQLRDILDKIKNREGLELLSEIRNVVGTD